ncbi:4'-phosphopantetheinyl transferase family protein [Paenibacillus sp. sgz500958]|uniref:4'-phosphopantetheinyl transferase family protein n=1 Tax=Paenibacillus sp. sgz500958 TaxID=3242475 RepID=UPI0036D30D61
MLIIAVSLESAFAIDELLPYVSPELRARSSRLRRVDDVRRSLVGEIIVRMFAMDIEGQRNDEIAFEKGVFGKPRLQHMREPWEYNISHSGKWVTGIVSRKNQRVGVDVQKMGAVKPSLSRYTMSPKELEHYLSLPLKAQRAYYYKLWTSKESYLKMEGIGISMPIRKVFTEGLTIQDETACARNGRTVCYFKQYPVDAGYSLTAASTDYRFPDECLLVKSSDLLDVFMRRCREQSQSTVEDITRLHLTHSDELVIQSNGVPAV